MKKLIIFVLLLSVCLAAVSCGPPTIDTAEKAAAKYIKATEPSAEWTSGVNPDENAVIIKYMCRNYYKNPDRVSQKSLDWWAETIDTAVDINKETKAVMDDTGYIADCYFYVYDVTKPDIMLLFVLNGEVEYNYLANAKDTWMNLDKYNSITMGMTLNEVRNIVGSAGEQLSYLDLGIGYEYVTEIYVWYAADGIGNATITFQGGKVVAMAQIGLE